MPVRNGRWVSWAKIIETANTINAGTTPPVEEDEPEPEPVATSKPRRSRAARRSAEAAVKEATGVEVSLDEIVMEDQQ